jgi:serine/threonine protein kinase
MTPERWQQVREVLEKALELAPSERSAFLNSACSSDQFLRREVETLLASSDGVRSDFLQSSTLRVALIPGTKLGDYEVKSLLGSGGMGEVYRARDSRLGRDVAIKVLPTFLSADSERLRRFEQEARAAASLNHPNILAVHQMGTYEGAPYLVSELLEGETLREHVKRGRLPIRKAIDYGVQMARGLAAAHEKGIVHRDLKPENLFITKDGRLKILDFGLAKLRQPQSDSENSQLTLTKGTEAGVVMGTVGYMSPEQVRGQAADHRADIFAFGAILYEMLAGKRAFQQPTSAETMTAILNEDPLGISQVTADIPAALQRIVHRCLEKNPEQRFQSASDLAFALDALSENAGSIVAAQPSAGLVRKRYYVLAVCCALLAAAFATYHFWPRSNTPSGPAKIRRISQWNKPMNGATLSPDGHAVAFTSPVGSVAQVFLMLTSGGEPLQLTSDEGDKYVDNFSPDGEEIYYTNSRLTEVWAVPTLGGAPRRVVSAGYVLPSPDGAFIYYLNYDRAGIFRSDKSGLNEELVYNPEGTGLVFVPTLLYPGGNELLAASVRMDIGNTFRFHRINVTSHKVVDLGEVSANYDVVRWAEPGETVLFSRALNGLTNIWKYRLSDGSLTQITFGTGPDFSPMQDPGGKGIYFVNGQSSGSLAAYHVQSKESKDIASEDANQPAISPDGKRVMYITLPAPERNELWVSDIDGGNKVKIATGEFLTTGTWWPDNLHLSFGGELVGKGSKAYIVGADGSGLRQLPPTIGFVSDSVLSPDQRVIYVTEMTGTEKGSPTPTVWKWNVDGSSLEKFVDNCAVITDVDPGGQYLLGNVQMGEKTGIYEVSISGKKCTLLLPGIATANAIFARDGKSFLYAVPSRGEATIYRQPWRDGKNIGVPQVALKVPLALGTDYDFARDLSTLVYARPGGRANLYLLSQN